MISLIEHKLYWKIVCQCKNIQIDYDSTLGNDKHFYCNYQVAHRVMLRNDQAYKYKTLYKVPCHIFHTYINGYETLHVGATMDIIFLHCIET